MKQETPPLKPDPTTPPVPTPLPQPQPLPRMNLSKLPLECDSMFMFNDHLTIVDCSKTLLHHLGYSRDELLGLKVPDVDIFETQESIAKKLNAIKKQGSVRLKTMHRRKDGSSMLVRQDIYYDEQKQLFTCYVKEEML
jgi:PAS domain S-box-containing protein